MKKIRTVLALAVLVPMLSACGPAPEDVCEHMMGIMKKELGEALPMSDDAFKAGHPAVPWRAPSDVRNRIVHGYWRTCRSCPHQTQ